VTDRPTDRQTTITSQVHSDAICSNRRIYIAIPRPYWQYITRLSVRFRYAWVTGCIKVIVLWTWNERRHIDIASYGRLGHVPPRLPAIYFLANVNSRSRSLYAVAHPAVVCRLSSVTFVRPTPMSARRFKFSAIFLRH